MERSKKRAVVVVPHQDDEILTGGAALVELIRSRDWETDVIYTTNGDSRGAWEAEIRMQDACRVLQFLGMSRDHIHFLGYANRWQGDMHIYNAIHGETLTSRIGRDETYGTKEIPDSCFKRENVHHKYTRKNLKEDLKGLLGEILPDLCIVIDLDKHEDHRACSLLFEECMGEILKELQGYKPLVLKKFAYTGVWKGEKDYWKMPHRPTALQEELPNPFLKWNERLQFAVPEDCNTKLLRKNTLFKASKLYRTQYVWTRAAGYLNDDICFWQRNSNNLALRASMKASSGNVECLKDFKIVDSTDIRDSIEWEFDAGIWSPEENDVKKEIMITFSDPVLARYFIIYECSLKNSGIRKLKLVINESVEKEILIEPGKKNVIELDDTIPKEIRSIKLAVIESYGQAIGISEIEILAEAIPLTEYDLPFKRYIGDSNEKADIWLKAVINMEEKCFKFKEHWVRNIWIPKWEFCNEHPVLLKKGYLYLPLEVCHILKKVLKKAGFKKKVVKR